jgi:hypothetical protein
MGRCDSFLQLITVLAFSTLSLSHAQCSLALVNEGSFICLWFYQWLVLRVLHDLLSVLLPAVLVMKLKALRRVLYLRDRAMRVHIAMVALLGSKVPAHRAFTLDPRL